jgi:hypothetical protein
MHFTQLESASIFYLFLPDQMTTTVTVCSTDILNKSSVIPILKYQYGDGVN